ncbi:lysylphosphatidylglycerol synthase transmembrane domain-containing protein [Fulvivirgaceae bacterium BMA10]|uniref:Lysylphosphatidylglycerol synthase transmembrane domain-containing protein n=1 Tax=Splendidivirga corallicola TaxID=3051826 RepID=A0ABT8KLB9_9BACT|nr:lysylphosphatidylglycerol synthase transmembrane domain-containing protein [Fulvivirgaceae bacterium BMA10]
MELDSKKIFKTLNPNKVWIPIIIGLGIVIYQIYTDEDYTTDKLNLIFEAKAIFVILAIIVLLARDVGYVYRIRSLTNKELSWNSCIYTIILWEFASAVTPSVVGGTAVAVFILYKEGINIGKSLAYVMLTAILDNLFFVVAAPLVIILTKGDIFPAIEGVEIRLGSTLQYLFGVSYLLIALYTFIMSYALFIRPRAFKWVLLKITSVRFLRRWRQGAYLHGNEIIAASAQLKGKSIRYWSRIVLSTIFIWCSRYFMLNCLIAAFAGVNIADQMVIFARQVILWIIMLVSPTPGSSGFSEYFFKQFFEGYLDGYTLSSQILWRGLTYYTYLLLGAIFLPRWIKRVFFKKKTDKVQGTQEDEAQGS